MGSSLPGTVTDEDLDRCIGEIILREAKAKAERYKKEGIRAYLPKYVPVKKFSINWHFNNFQNRS